MESQRQAGPLPAGASRVYLSASDILANALLSLFQCTARKPQCLPPPPAFLVALSHKAQDLASRVTLAPAKISGGAWNRKAWLPLC